MKIDLPYSGKIVKLGLIIIVSGLVISNLGLGWLGAASADSNWYVGQGARPNTYYTYKIQSHDTNQGQPFAMTVYFKEHNDTGHYWVAPVYVNDQGAIINGTFHLSDLDLSALGNSQISPSMSPYRSAYETSLQWLASFVPKPGQSLSAPYWGKIASIGGSPISPGPQEKITVPAGTFDTTVVSWHKGVDNKIWINKDMPYPIKAQTFADVTTGNPPIFYQFELLSTGQGPPPIPKSQLEIPKPPITLQTGRGTYYIELLWQPQLIKSGNETQFGVLFMDSSQSVVPGVSYSFKVTGQNNTVIEDLHDQKAIDGTGTQTVKFDKPGPIDILVSIDGVQGQNLGDFVEKSDFNLVVVPPGNMTK